jgi:hypothetical protein
MFKLKNIQNRNFYYLLALIAILTFSNFIYTGFSTNDDYEYYTRYFTDANVWKSSYEYAKMNGRFYFAFMQPLFNIIIPYSFDSLVLTRIFNLVLIFLGAIIFAINLKIVFKTSKYSYLFVLFYLVFVTIKGGNNPIISYPFYFSTSWVFFQLATYFFIKFLNDDVKKYKFYSLFFYSLALLFYEMYLVYSLMFIAITFIFYYNLNWKISVLNLFKKNNLLMYANIVYVVVYYAFKKQISSELYDGVNIAGEFKFYSFARAMFYLSKGAMPLHLYFSGHGVYDNCSYLLGGHVQSVLTPILNIKIEWLVKSILVATGLMIIAKKYKETNSNLFDVKQKIMLFLLSFALIYVPHFLLALTVKYQYYTNMGMDNYITSYFSSFIFFSWLVFLTYLILSIKYDLVKNIVFALFVFIVSVSSILIDYSNFHAKKDLEKVYEFFESIDYLVKSEDFKAIKDSSVIVAPDLFKVNSDISYYNVGNFDIMRYVKAKTNRTFIFFKDSSLINTPNPNNYFLTYKTTKNGYYFLITKANSHETKLFIRSTKSKETINVFDRDSVFSDNITLNNKEGMSTITYKKFDHNRFVVAN